MSALVRVDTDNLIATGLDRWQRNVESGILPIVRSSLRLRVGHVDIASSVFPTVLRASIAAWASAARSRGT